MQTAQELFEKGIDLQQRGLFSHAIAEYERALEIEPHNVDIMLNLGAACLQYGLSDKAIKFLTRVLQKDPGNTLALYNIGKAFVYRDDPETALEAFYKANELMPDDIDVKKSIASCYKSLKRYQEAAELTDSFINKVIDDYDYIMNHAETLMCIEDYMGALDIYRKAVDLACDSSEPLMGIFKCQQRLGNREKAITALKRAMMLEPENQDFHIKLVDILIEDGKIQEAADLLKQGIESLSEFDLLEEKFNELTRRLPILKKRSGLTALRRKTSPYEMEVYDILDNLYNGTLKFDSAIKELQTMREKDPEDLFIADELANLFFQARMFDEAAEIYSQIHTSVPSAPRYRIDLAKSLAMKGDIVAARAILKDSLRDMGHLLELNLAMTELDLFEKDFEKAAGRLEMIKKEFPEDNHAVFLYGYTAMRLDNLNKAEESFNQLLENGCLDEELALWYSRLCVLKGCPQKALKVWETGFNDDIKSLVEVITKAELTLASGMSDKVVEHLKCIGEYHPRFIEDHLLFGKAFFFAANFADAQREFDLVLKHETKNSEAMAMSAINYLIRGKSSKFWRYWQYAIDCDTLFAVLPAMILKNTFNFSQKERLKSETKKILDISNLSKPDKSRIVRLLNNL